MTPDQTAKAVELLTRMAALADDWSALLADRDVPISTQRYAWLSEAETLRTIAVLIEGGSQ